MRSAALVPPHYKNVSYCTVDSVGAFSYCECQRENLRKVGSEGPRKFCHQSVVETTSCVPGPRTGLLWVRSVLETFPAGESAPLSSLLWVTSFGTTATYSQGLPTPLHPCRLPHPRHRDWGEGGERVKRNTHYREGGGQQQYRALTAIYSSDRMALVGRSAKN